MKTTLKPIPVGQKDFEDVADKSHTQNTDTKLDEGGVNEVSAADVNQSVTDTQAASETPAANVIPKADSDGLLDIRWMGLPLESAGAYGFRWNPDDDTHMELGSGGTGKIANSFRGIENFFGSIWKWVDGINVNDWLVWACQNPADFADDVTTNYSQIVDQYGNPIKLPESNDYQKHLWAGTFFPSSVGGGSSTYITDYFYQNSGWRVVRFGGRLYDGSAAGVSYLNVAADSTSDSPHVGSRNAA